MAYKVGDTFVLSPDALENYGEQYADKVYKVRQWFSHYAPPGSNDPHGHPGYDEGAGGRMYEADGLNFALYDWEMRRPGKSAGVRNPSMAGIGSKAVLCRIKRVGNKLHITKVGR